jgi:lysophospholipase L1-like esterase
VLLTLFLFFLKKTGGKKLALRLGLVAMTFAAAGTPLISSIKRFPEERANQLPFHFVSGPPCPEDLAWYFHPLLRRFNSFLSDHTFRSFRKTLEKEPKNIRIACLGTSSTWGYPLRPEQSYPARLEERMRARGVSCDILNAAIPGSSALRLTHFFQGVVTHFSPDIVTLSLFFNDVSACLQMDEEEELRATTTAGYQASFIHRLKKNFQLSQSKRAYLEARDLYAREGTRSESLRMPIVAIGLERFRKNLSSLVDAALSAGARVLLIKEPARPSSFLQEEMYVVIEEVGRQRDVAVFDLNEKLQRKPEETALLDWVHPTAQGHEFIAEALEEELEALGWMRGAR